MPSARCAGRPGEFHVTKCVALSCGSTGVSIHGADRRLSLHRDVIDADNWFGAALRRSMARKPASVRDSSAKWLPISCLYGVRVETSGGVAWETVDDIGGHLSISLPPDLPWYAWRVLRRFHLVAGSEVGRPVDLTGSAPLLSGEEWAKAALPCTVELEWLSEKTELPQTREAVLRLAITDLMKDGETQIPKRLLIAALNQEAIRVEDAEKSKWLTALATALTLRHSQDSRKGMAEHLKWDYA